MYVIQGVSGRHAHVGGDLGSGPRSADDRAASQPRRQRAARQLHRNTHQALTSTTHHTGERHLQNPGPYHGPNLHQYRSISLLPVCAIIVRDGAIYL